MGNPALQPVLRIPTTKALIDRGKGRGHVFASTESGPYSRIAW